MDVGPEKLVSIDEFFDWLSHQEGRYELVNGQIRMMTGATYRHNIVKDNVAYALRVPARTQGCNATTSDTGVRTGPRGVRYPDVVVDCGPPDLDSMTASNPTIIIEVSSPGTRDADLGVKLWEYQSLASVQIIIQIEPDVVFVAVHRRTAGGWQVDVHESLDTAIELPPLNTALPMRAIYDGVEVKPRPKLQLVDGGTIEIQDR
jgi:Uma2 family endonuclease